VTTLWAGERLYYLLHAEPGFRTKPQIGANLASKAKDAGVRFRAAVADCFYGDHDGFRGEIRAADLAYVLALKPARIRGPGDGPRTPR
jgi:SRSO17 transposase